MHSIYIAVCSTITTWQRFLLSYWDFYNFLEIWRHLFHWPIKMQKLSEWEEGREMEVQAVRKFRSPWPPSPWWCTSLGVKIFGHQCLERKKKWPQFCMVISSNGANCITGLYMSFNFIFGSILIALCFIFIIILPCTKTKQKWKLNQLSKRLKHNTYIFRLIQFIFSWGCIHQTTLNHFCEHKWKHE